MRARQILGGVFCVGFLLVLAVGLGQTQGPEPSVESGLGVGIQGTFSKGPVTLLRIGGTQMEKIWLAEGEIIKTGYAENLCRTQAEVRLTQGNVLELLHAPLGNHLILVKGHHNHRLRTWWETMIDR